MRHLVVLETWSAIDSTYLLIIMWIMLVLILSMFIMNHVVTAAVSTHIPIHAMLILSFLLLLAEHQIIAHVPKTCSELLIYSPIKDMKIGEDCSESGSNFNSRQSGFFPLPIAHQIIAPCLHHVLHYQSIRTLRTWMLVTGYWCCHLEILVTRRVSYFEFWSFKFSN